MFLFTFLVFFAFNKVVFASEVYVPVISKPSKAFLELNPSKSEDLASLLSIVSETLLGKPYKLGPLGEGENQESPLYRLDAFDCTTFIETVMANAYCHLAGSKMSVCLSKRMQEIRYSGSKISYQERNHIPELDWLPNNVKRGFLKDLSENLFPNEWLNAKITIDRELWLSLQGKGIVKKAPSPLKENRTIKYIPVSYFFTKNEISGEKKKSFDEKLLKIEYEITKKKNLKEISSDEIDKLMKDKFRVEMELLREEYVPIIDRLNHIPSGTILNLVHAPIKDPEKAKGSPVITHQGLIILKSDGAYIRQAAKNVNYVGNQKLGDYLLKYVRSGNVRGVSLYQILPLK